MKRRDALQLRLELLRLRGSLERAEVAAALTELRAGAAPLARIVGAASSLQGGWIGALAAKPAWVASAASTAWVLLRAARRHPRLLALAAVGGALAWIASGRGAGRRAER